MPPRVADILTPLPIGQSVWFGPSCEWTDMPSCACRLPFNTVSGRFVRGVVCSVGIFFQMSLWFSMMSTASFFKSPSPRPCRGQWLRGWALGWCLGSGVFGRGWGGVVLRPDGLTGGGRVLTSWGCWERGGCPSTRRLAPSPHPRPVTRRAAAPAVWETWFVAEEMWKLPVLVHLAGGGEVPVWEARSV